jgi:short-subunit dehydrogenase
MSNTALITGASSGIGTEFARLHAEAGGDMVIVARRQEALEELKVELEAAHKVSVIVLAADLGAPNAAQALFEKTEAAGIQVDVLINNAGFGGHGKFNERDLAKDQAMIDLNISTLTQLTHLYLQGMIKRNHGKVLNVASTAAFMPGPLQAVYYATKAYVLSFSQAIAEELSDTKITVTALCPGAVKTGFVAAADLDGVDIFEKAASPRSVAEHGYKAMLSGKLATINERGLSFQLNWIIPLLPRKAVLKLSRKFMEKT